MNALEEAFLDADFNWTMALQNIWTDSPVHVPELHAKVGDDIMRDFRRLGRTPWTQALGKVVTGPVGSGKTHLISDLRRRAWEAKGWFVFIDIVGVTDFWRTVVLGFIESLRQPLNGLPQYEAVFKAALRTIDPAKAKSVALEADDLGAGATATVNLFVKLLKASHPEGQQHADVVRALLLQRDPETMDIAYAWLQGLDVPQDDRAKLGLAASPPDPVMIVRGISWLMSLSGPTMIALDQIDSIVSMGSLAKAGDTEGEIQVKAKAVFELFAGGLMDLRDQTRRSMTVLSCYQESWGLIATRSLKSVSDRFMLPPHVLYEDAATPTVVAAIVARRLAQFYAEADAAPPSPIWPFNAAFCEQSKDLVPRHVLRRCEEYRQTCLRADEVLEWSADAGSPGPAADVPEALDVLFERLRADAEVPTEAVLYADEGQVLADVLRDALGAFAQHLPLADGDDVELLVESEVRKPVIHARLKLTSRAETEVEDHFCFRVLGHGNPRAFQARLAAAITASGIDKAMPRRRLAVLRATPLPTGKVTDDLKTRFATGGGSFVAPTGSDLRTFMALRAMADGKASGLDAWLEDRRPFCGTDLFKRLGLCGPPWTPKTPVTRASPAESVPESAAGPGSAVAISADGGRPPDADAGRSAADAASAPPAAGARPAATSIPLGPKVQGGALGAAAELPVENLTRHTALFAGSGSGKTVLLRRIVEEAALLGIPAIVLDTNNDLARLGTPWPSRPDAFTDEDAEKAARYFRDVEIAVWTPGAANGRALTLAVMPDFAVAADGEERSQAVDMAWATLVPLIGAAGAGKVLKEGLLKEALTAFASGAGTGIEAFIDFLADLPGEVSKLSKAGKLASEMSDQLRAKIAVNPLLNAKGQPLDPAVLFAAERAGATRISVINFAGLETESARQDFVNQLQMALFAFVKRRPSATPRLYVCDEAQNFAPSGMATACKASAIALARQGRKFGLGMIFATQAPKGIDTNIVSNCVTHFYGRMASPALMDAAEEMMAARGKAARDLGALTRGTFYFSTEGTPQPVKIRTPLCLSFHPQNPATPEEVIAMARKDR